MQLCKATLAALGTMVFLSAPALFAQEGNNLTGHAGNLAVATDTVVNMTNTGSSWQTLYAMSGGSVQASTGNICVNAYALNAGGGVDWCCQCILTPNALSGFSLAGLNTISAAPANLTIKLIATVVGPFTSSVYNPATFSYTAVSGVSTCDATTVNAGLSTATLAGGAPNPNVLGNGLIAWQRGATGGDEHLATGQLGTQEVIKLNGLCASNKAGAAGGAKGYCGTVAGSFAGATGICVAGGL